MTPLKIMEQITPEKFIDSLPEPLPSPKQAVKLEQYREKGCEVEYNLPDWIKEEREKGTVFEDYFSKRPIEEYLHEIPRTREKKEYLSKQYKFVHK
jgi:hypothetical protein